MRISQEHTKAPGPNGLPAEFYQHFWNVVKDDWMAMFCQLHKCDLPLNKLNFDVTRCYLKRKMQSKYNSIDRFVY
jgi:hypothetical protein